MSDCFLQFASFTDRFVGCISNYFETNPDKKKELTNEKQKKKFRNPRMFLFGEPEGGEKPKGSEKPKGKKNVKLKSKYATVNTGKSIQERYDTPKNPGMLNSKKKSSRLYCMDSVCSTLLILAYYLNRNKISTEEYYSCIDSMIESLSNISIEIESSENTDNLINELLHARKEILDDQYGTKVEENYNYNYEEYKEMDIKLSLDGLEQALTRIREESLNGERIKNYINVIMVRLLLTRYVRLLEKKEIHFYDFFNSIVSEKIGDDAMAKSKYFDFMLEDSDIPNFESAVNTIDKLQIIPERENDAKRFLLASDFDFWLDIINNVGDNPKFEALNTKSKEYMDTITYKLKLYRNKVSHSGDNDPSPEMVVRTLRTILDFAEKSDLKKEAVIVKKYYLYELYRCYDYDTKHFISYRYDLDFSSYRFPKSPDVPCWKEVCPVIIDVEKSIEIENKNLKEWKKETKEIKGLFFGREELNTDVVKSIWTL